MRDAFWWKSALAAGMLLVVIFFAGRSFLRHRRWQRRLKNGTFDSYDVERLIIRDMDRW